MSFGPSQPWKIGISVRCRCHLRGITSVFFLRKTCLYITYIGKGIIPALAKREFYSILLNVDDNCYKRAADRTEK